MNLTELKRLLWPHMPCEDADIRFQGIKWQEEHHPSAEKFPIDFLKVETTGKKSVTITFITKPHKYHETK